jgi:pimeloyl-ACP methyl ester carboxylesterase
MLILREAILMDTIIPYPGPSAGEAFPMKPWPALAPMAKQLRLRGGRDTIFFYDTANGMGAGTGGAAKKPALLLIHGLGDEADSWRRLIPALSAEGYRVLAPDLPGFGRSTAGGRISRAGHTAAALRLLAETGCASPDNPAVLVGSSMGALIAQDAACRQPGLVRGLVLLDGCFPSPAPFNTGLLYLALPFLGKKWYRAFRTNHDGAYQSLFGYYADFQGMDGADRDFLRERVIARVESPSQERAYFASLRSLMGTYLTRSRSFSRRIAAFPGRLLILWGGKDRVLPPDSAGKLRALRPDAAFKIIPAAGHLPHQEQPAQTAGAILRWLTTDMGVTRAPAPGQFCRGS